MRDTFRSMALLALPTMIGAVALSDMAPQASNLPDACNKVYMQQIPGCAVADFTSRDCSTTCVRALYSLVGSVKQACGGQGITGKNLIVAFLSDAGPQALCKNANAVGGGGHATSWPLTTTAHSVTETSSLVFDSSSTASQTTKPSQTTITSGTSTASNGSGTGLLVDTSSTPSGSPTTSGNSQLNTNDGSGGGSPFDTAGNTGSTASSLSVSLALTFLSAVGALVVAVR